MGEVRGAQVPPTDRLRLCLVATYNTFYRNGVFEHIARALDTRFVFFSKGGEHYWLKEHGVYRGAIDHTYLRGFELAGTRITPGLFRELVRARYDVFLKCVNGRFALPATYLVARLLGRPFVLWTEVWMRYRTLGHRLGYPLTRYIYRNADAIVACGEHVAAFLRAEGVAPERIFVARHAVDNALYARPMADAETKALRARLKIGPNQRVLLFVGRLTEVKGLPFILRALAALDDPRVVLVLVGTGEQEAALQALTRELGIEGRVRFAGYVEPAATMPYYAIAWCLVLPSIELDHVKETWGLVVNEAFNQGVPVIATDAVGAAAGGLVHDGVTGFVLPEKDTAALTDAIGRLLVDPSLRERMSQAARAEIDRWTQESMADTFIAAVRSAHAGRCRAHAGVGSLPATRRRT